MGPLLWRLSALLTGVGLLVVGVGLLFSVLGLRAGLADFSSITLGLVTSAYFVGFVAGTYACPVVIRRVGHIRAFAAMASLASTMPILHALWVDPWFWGLLRFVTGVCMVGLYIVIESWLNALAPNALRGPPVCGVHGGQLRGAGPGPVADSGGRPAGFRSVCHGVGDVFVRAAAHHHDRGGRAAAGGCAHAQLAQSLRGLAHRHGRSHGLGPDHRGFLRHELGVWQGGGLLRCRGGQFHGGDDSGWGGVSVAGGPLFRQPRSAHGVDLGLHPGRCGHGPGVCPDRAFGERPDSPGRLADSAGGGVSAV